MASDNPSVRLKGNGSHSLTVTPLRDPPMVMVHAPGGYLSFTVPHRQILADFVEELVSVLTKAMNDAEDGGS